MPLVTRTSIAGEVLKQDEEPSNKTNGTIWVDTGDSPPSINVADGSKYNMPSFKLKGVTKVPGEALL